MVSCKCKIYFISTEEQHQIIAGCKINDRASQTKLYDSYAPKMMGVCLRYCKNNEEAEDVLQEGFIRIFNYLHQYRGDGSFEGWMRRIMVNCALRKFQGQSKMHAVVPLENNMEFASVQANAISQIGNKELVQMVQKLPTAYRMVFNLFVFEGMKHREIADLLKITEGTSKSNLNDARLILKRQLETQMKIAK